MTVQLFNFVLVDERDPRGHHPAANGRSVSPGGLNLNIPPRRSYVRGSPSPNSAQSGAHSYHEVTRSQQFGEAQEVSGEEFNRSNGSGHVQQQVQYFQQQFGGQITPPPTSPFQQRQAYSYRNTGTPPLNNSMLPPSSPSPPPPPRTSTNYPPSGYSPSPPPPPARATPPSNLFNSPHQRRAPPATLFGAASIPPDNGHESTTPTNSSMDSSIPNSGGGGGGGFFNNYNQPAPHPSQQQPTTPQQDFVNGGSRSNLHISLPSPAFTMTRPRRVASPGSLSLPFHSPASGGRPASPGSISLPGMTPSITTPSPGAFGHSPLSLNIPSRQQGSEGRSVLCSYYTVHPFLNAKI